MINSLFFLVCTLKPPQHHNGWKQDQCCVNIFHSKLTSWITPTYGRQVVKNMHMLSFNKLMLLCYQYILFVTVTADFMNFQFLLSQLFKLKIAYIFYIKTQPHMNCVRIWQKLIWHLNILWKIITGYRTK